MTVAEPVDLLKYPFW